MTFSPGLWISVQNCYVTFYSFGSDLLFNVLTLILLLFFSSLGPSHLKTLQNSSTKCVTQFFPRASRSVIRILRKITDSYAILINIKKFRSIYFNLGPSLIDHFIVFIFQMFPKRSLNVVYVWNSQINGYSGFLAQRLKKSNYGKFFFYRNKSIVSINN